MKNKIWLFVLFLVGLASPALADVGDGMMNNFGMMGSGVGMGFIGILFFAIGSFIFALIFWLVYLWIVPKKKR